MIFFVISQRLKHCKNLIVEMCVGKETYFNLSPNLSNFAFKYNSCNRRRRYFDNKSTAIIESSSSGSACNKNLTFSCIWPCVRNSQFMISNSLCQTKTNSHMTKELFLMISFTLGDSDLVSEWRA